MKMNAATGSVSVLFYGLFFLARTLSQMCACVDLVLDRSASDQRSSVIRHAILPKHMNTVAQIVNLAVVAEKTVRPTPEALATCKLLWDCRLTYQMFAVQ